MFEITVDTVFSASHQLRLYDGRLEPLHGHNWQVKLAVRGAKLDAIGVVCDFHSVQRALYDVCDRFNNAHLNNRPEFAQLNPTAENVCVVVGQQVQERLGDRIKVHTVAVTEAPGCEAKWFADGAG